MELDGKGLCCVGAPYGVTRQRWRGGLGWGRCVGQGGQRDVASRFASGRAILAMKFRGEAVQRAGPHVLRGRGGVWSAGSWRAALGGSA